VIQSPHKTLTSLTQTALLHLNGKRVDPDRIERELDIFETSSPSYPLMASLDGCTGILRKEGADLFEKWKERLARFDEAVHSLQKIRILGHGSQSAAVNDPGKILINTRRAGMTGQETAGLLRDQFRLETEYARGFHVLAMSSPCDSEDALDRLAAALLDLDMKAAAPVSVEKNRTDSTDALPVQELLMIRPVTACTIACAAEQEAEEVPLTEASGRICAEYLYDYPPGIPFLIPGEFITRKIIEILEKEAENGRAFYGHRGREGVILCLRE
jgi:arginine/lysine/ornithine decarboxylase